MIDFLKFLIKKLQEQTENNEINKMKKILYSLIIMCSIVFVGLLIYIIIKAWPDFTSGLNYSWNDAKSTLIKLK